jgi:hypothetical protein
MPGNAGSGMLRSPAVGSVGEEGAKGKNEQEKDDQSQPLNSMQQFRQNFCGTGSGHLTCSLRHRLRYRHMPGTGSW